MFLGEYEPKLGNSVKLLFKRLICVYGKTGCGYGQPVSFGDRGRKIVLDGFGPVIKHFGHLHILAPCCLIWGFSR